MFQPSYAPEKIAAQICYDFFFFCILFYALFVYVNNACMHANLIKEH